MTVIIAAISEGCMQGFERHQTMNDVTKELLEHLRPQFRVHRVFIADNGPQFENSAFCRISNFWDIEHVASPPRYHPRSNRTVESAIRIEKTILGRCKLNDTNVWRQFFSGERRLRQTKKSRSSALHAADSIKVNCHTTTFGDE